MTPTSQWRRRRSEALVSLAVSQNRDVWAPSFDVREDVTSGSALSVKCGQSDRRRSHRQTPFALHPHLFPPRRFHTDQPADAPTGRRADRRTDRPIDGPTDRRTDRPTDRPTARPTVRPTDRPIDRPTDRPTI